MNLDQSKVDGLNNSRPVPAPIGAKSEITIFSNPEFGDVRTAGTPDNPLFCLKDLCVALGLSNPAKVRQRLADDVTSSYTAIDALGKKQEMLFVNEDGLYDTILHSRKPVAKKFRKWVTGEVLPTIRKTGGYIPEQPEDTDADIMAKALLIAQKTIENKSQRIQMLEGENAALAESNKALAAKNEELEPKAQYVDEVLNSPATYTFTQIAKECGFTSGTSFIRRLVADGFLFKQSGMYMPRAKFSARGLTATRTARFFRADGSPDTKLSTVVTENGRAWLNNHYR